MTKRCRRTSGRERPVRPWKCRLKPARHALPVLHAQARSRALPWDRPVVHGRGSLVAAISAHALSATGQRRRLSALRPARLLFAALLLSVIWRPAPALADRA